MEPVVPIVTWPREDRPREKLLDRGAGALTDSELLAVLLGTGRGHHTALDVARLVLLRFGDLRALERAGSADLAAIAGVGPAKAARLKAALELGRRVGRRPLPRHAPLRSGRDVFLAFRDRLGPLRKEQFLALVLDGKHRPTKELLVSEALTASIVHPREVFEPLIRETAAATLLIHNHPSGDPTPSAEDLEITQRLREVGELVGIRVLDHVIIAEGGFTSLAEAGWPHIW